MLYAANGCRRSRRGWSLSELSVDGVLMSRLEQRKPMLGLASDRELPAGPALISAAAGCECMDVYMLPPLLPKQRGTKSGAAGLLFSLPSMYESAHARAVTQRSRAAGVLHGSEQKGSVRFRM
jgi:hypothetical protein